MKLIDFLKPQTIKIPLEQSTKTGVIEELTEVLQDNGLISDKDVVLEAVLEREKIMTTGVGNGVAIPHCKHASCTNFAIALGIHPQGVDFQSIDGKPVQIIFLLVGPDDQPGMHIRLLSRISRLISKADIREKILQCHTPEEIYDLLKKEEAKFFELTP